MLTWNLDGEALRRASLKLDHQKQINLLLRYLEFSSRVAKWCPGNNAQLEVSEKGKGFFLIWHNFPPFSPNLVKIPILDLLDSLLDQVEMACLPETFLEHF